jgi:hypothetical protein
MTTDASSERVADQVHERYANAALAVQAGSGCCNAGCCTSLADDAVTRDLYDEAQTELLPEEALLASLRCGNPTAHIDLKEGETVLDLGSGGGTDVLLSAKRVGPSGFVYGVDMADDQSAGFEDSSIEVIRRYRMADADIDTTSLPEGWEEADGKIVSAFIRATKPLASPAEYARSKRRDISGKNLECQLASGGR